MAKCVVCGFEDNSEDKKRFGNYIVYRSGEPICWACEEDNGIFLDCGFKPSKLKQS